MIKGTRLRNAKWEVVIWVEPAIGGVMEPHKIYYRALEARPGKWDVWRYREEGRSKKKTRGGKYVGASSIEEVAAFLAEDTDYASRELVEIRKVK